MTAAALPLRAAPALGVIRVTGPDAGTFLHAQLTQRVRDIDATRSKPAAWLDAQGRVLACFDVVATAGGIDLVTTAELVETLVRRLRLYVLRARVVVETPAAPVAALLGDGRERLAADGVELGDAAGSRATADGAEWFRAGPGLAYVYPAPDAASPAGDDVELAEIRLGRPRIGKALSGEFTAHMLNLDAHGAIAFDKGCYPGQEVVARTQNLGAAKRRLFGFRAPGGAPPAPGDAVTDASGTEVGTVVRAARSPDGIELIAVVRLDAIGSPLSVVRRESSALDAGSHALPLERRPVPGEPAG